MMNVVVVNDVSGLGVQFDDTSRVFRIERLFPFPEDNFQFFIDLVVRGVLVGYGTTSTQ